MSKDAAADSFYNCRTDLITMSLEQLKALLTKVNDDSSLQEKLKATKSTENVVGVAKEHGHKFSTENLSQLSQEEPDGVAGSQFKWHETDVSLMGFPIGTP